MSDKDREIRMKLYDKRARDFFICMSLLSKTFAGREEAIKSLRRAVMKAEGSCMVEYADSFVEAFFKELIKSSIFERHDDNRMLALFLASNVMDSDW